MELKIISFNIRCCDDKNGHSIPERAPRLQRIIGDLGADIIGLQECTPRWEEYIPEYFGAEYDMYFRHRDANAESTPILWRRDRFKCIKTGHFWLSDTPEVESKGWDCVGFPRICVYALHEDNSTGAQLVAASTHFGFGDEGQVKSADLLTERLASLGMPYLVVGDFNMNPKSVGYAEITMRVLDVNAETVNDLRDTYHEYDPSKFRDEHIDYCFVSREFKPLDQRILDESVDGKYPSDHFGIISLVEL